MVYAFVHLTGWNFKFLSQVEQILWRVSSLILVGTTALFWVLEAGAILQRYGSNRKLWTEVLRKEDKKSDVTVTVVEDALVESRATPSKGEPSTLEPRQQLLQQRDVEEDEDPWAPKQLPLVWEFWSILSDRSHLRHGEGIYPRRAIAWLKINAGEGV
ncbi:hypothetical protein TGAM01_v209707 [Trichoderma gamsii]|uniref:Uncharacterized protein n=1 Tax=Trichoderma gamsii TaxID=398673 RepID=A0A2P4ZAX0_9HYPO|nr:hypothetical protein TGAM01_v209707 [Trichoderma gamsii]PON21406.1 hypothetical protein TGAM01_v209707 [Trichoderma gamsii]